MNIDRHEASGTTYWARNAGGSASPRWKRRNGCACRAAIPGCTTAKSTGRSTERTHAIYRHDPGSGAYDLRPGIGSSKHPVLVGVKAAVQRRRHSPSSFRDRIARRGRARAVLRFRHAAWTALAGRPGPVPGAGWSGPAWSGCGAGRSAGGWAGVPSIGATAVRRLIKALDWLEAESTKAGSRFQNKVEVKRVAAMGMSCGGLMAYDASDDPRIATVGIWNSGLTEPDPELMGKIHSSVIIVTGNDTDVAYANAGSFETCPRSTGVLRRAPPSTRGTYIRTTLHFRADGRCVLKWHCRTTRAHRRATSSQ